MKISNNNFISIPPEADELSVSDDNYTNEMCHDPLNGVGSEEPEKFYREDSVVFAEPLESVLNRENPVSSEPDEQISCLNNVMVKKTAGKKNNKYYIDIEDASNPVCPQPNCARSFTTVTLLKAHVRKVHCADRCRYVCERCGAGFAAEYLMRRHAHVHGAARAECPVCHKMLSRRTNLAAHVRAHGARRSHACRSCDKRFARKATLDVHVKFVHRRGDLECDKCAARFTSRMQWTRHNASHKTAS